MKNHMHKIFITMMFFSVLQAEDIASNDLAYVMVMEKINKKVVPLEYINKVFTSSDIERHQEIQSDLLGPMKKILARI